MYSAISKKSVRNGNMCSAVLHVLQVFTSQSNRQCLENRQSHLINLSVCHEGRELSPQVVEVCGRLQQVVVVGWPSQALVLGEVKGLEKQCFFGRVVVGLMLFVGVEGFLPSEEGASSKLFEK